MEQKNESKTTYPNQGKATCISISMMSTYTGASGILYANADTEAMSFPGKYALLHHDYLHEHHPQFYNKLIATKKLHLRLKEIDGIAKRRLGLAAKVGQTFEEAEQALLSDIVYALHK